uniref:Uncharacterized protein n=1 Tax=Panagrolaimus sp. JU765 TaxID=591449 RepID=A0AC34QME2_9BILA
MSVFHWFRNRQSTGDIEVIQPDGTTQVTLSEQTRKMNVCRLLVFVFYIIVAIGCAVAISCLIGIQSNEFIRQNEAFFLARPPRQT